MTDLAALLARGRGASVLHEDEHVLAINKPAGLTVVPARNEPEEHCLRKVLEQHRRERLWVVHRLDRETSGVLLFARTESAHRTLSLAFEHRETEKHYLAWLRGAPSPPAGSIDVPLHTARKGKMRPALEGETDTLEAHTKYTVEHSTNTLLGRVSRVRFQPLTGRQHQLRVHARYISAPLLLDVLYGATREESLDKNALGPGAPELLRIPLHAAELRVPHPARAETLQLRAPLPEDLAALDAWLTR